MPRYNTEVKRGRTVLLYTDKVVLFKYGRLNGRYITENVT